MSLVLRELEPRRLVVLARERCTAWFLAIIALGTVRRRWKEKEYGTLKLYFRDYEGWISSR